MNVSCIFCKIVAGQVPAHIVAQNDDVVVIKDRAPQAPIHYLIMPRKHIEHVGALAAGDEKLAGKLLMMAQQLAQQDPACAAFRLVGNNGTAVGQTVPHLHLHFMAGKTMAFE